MAKESVRRVPTERAATLAEIVAAIQALSPADIRKLKRVAQVRIWRIGKAAAAGRTAEDLLQTAVTALLDDTRRWDRTKVGFVRFLSEAMKSISSNWAKSYDDEHLTVLESELGKTNQEGAQFNAYQAVADQRSNPEKALRDRETLQRIDELFRDDREAQQILMAWQEGYDPPGVRDLWGLSQNDYNTIVRRIRRKLEAAGITTQKRGKGGSGNVQ